MPASESPHIIWVSGVSGTGITAQSDVITSELERRGYPVSHVVAKPLDTDHTAPYITDDSGAIYPVESVQNALLAVLQTHSDPSVVVFHSANQHVREAHSAIQPHAITLCRLGVNFREQMLAGPQFSHQIPDLIDFLQSVDHIIPSTNRAKGAMKTHGITDSRLTRIPTAIHAPEDKIREPTRDAPESVGVIGRLCKVKNQLVIAEAISGLRECTPPIHPTLAIAGKQSQNDGVPQAMQGMLPALAPNFQTQILGYVDNPLQDFYPEIGVHAHPSWTENCPQTLLEAAVCGVPSVVSDMAWADAYDIRFPSCSPDSPWSWTCKFHDFLTDAEYRFELAKEQQQAVLDNYRVRDIAEDYQDLFASLCDAYQTFKVPAGVRAT